MFFSPELLQRRDSGLGLLWLAATLGPKSHFKKLAKRSILTADISELCSLVCQPPEPLSLRLSSNLMIGVVRVYRVKNELLYSDASNCVTCLKKAVQELRDPFYNTVELHPTQLTARHENLTLPQDPAVDFELEFGLMDDAIAHSYSVGPGHVTGDNFSLANATPNTVTLSKLRNSQKLHLLDESHDLLVSDLMSGGGFDTSGFGDLGFGANFFSFEGVEDEVGVLGEMSEEIAREAGGSWLSLLNDGGLKKPANTMDHVSGFDYIPSLENDTFPQGLQVGAALSTVASPAPNGIDIPVTQSEKRKRSADELENEECGADKNGHLPPSVERSKHLQPLEEVQNMGNSAQTEQNYVHRRRLKRARLMVDERTQLTDEEMKTARQNYLSNQFHLRQEFRRQHCESTAAMRVARMIWDCPRGFVAPMLQTLWRTQFKEVAKSAWGYTYLDEQILARKQGNRLPETRIKSGVIDKQHSHRNYSPLRRSPADNLAPDMPAGPETIYDFNLTDAYDFGGAVERAMSSSDIGQARARSSHPRSVQVGSQSIADRSSYMTATDMNVPPWESFFPASSNTMDEPLGQSLDVGLEGIEHEWLTGETARGVGDHGEEGAENAGLLNVTRTTLERNAHGFLDLNVLAPEMKLTLRQLLPAGSSRRIASDAFYQCLVLTTKGLVKLEQKSPYGEIVVYRNSNE